MDDEEVLAYLEAENEYFDASMAPYQGLIDTIYKEIEGRQPAELASLPRKRGSGTTSGSTAKEASTASGCAGPRPIPMPRRAPPATFRCSSMNRAGGGPGNRRVVRGQNREHEGADRMVSRRLVVLLHLAGRQRATVAGPAAHTG